MKNKIIFTFLAVAVLAGVGFYIKNNLFETNQISPAIQGPAVQGQSLDGGVAIQGDDNTKGVKIEQVEIKNNSKTATNIPAPNLDRKVNFSTANENIKEKIVEISEKLKINMTNISLWIDLGSLRKVIGDYEGAKLAWEYVTVIAPQSGLAFRNLGDLYGYYLGNPQKAEENFLKAIQNEPNQIEYYFKIADFYREIAKDPAKARAILEKGNLK